MLCYIHEVQKGENVAGFKARIDVDSIFAETGMQPVNLDYVLNMTYAAADISALQKVKRKFDVTAAWSETMKEIPDGSTVVIQYPILRNPIGYVNMMKKLHRRNVRICLLIHDIEMFRNYQYGDNSALFRKSFTDQDAQILQTADFFIAHNKAMKEKMVGIGIPVDRIIVLGIFDYLIPDYDPAWSEKFHREAPVVVAGSLIPSKCGYLYQMPDSIECNAYGVHYKENGNKNLHYMGSFAPDELPGHLEGSFGLVWDGPETTTCAGNTGNYLRINNPHKTSLYLATGMPVVIWKEAALAPFVEENRCGITVDSLEKLAQVLAGMTDDEYAELKANAASVSERLRSGYYTKRAIEELKKKI